MDDFVKTFHLFDFLPTCWEVYRITEFTAHTFPSFARRDNLVSLALRARAFEAKNSTDNY